ncbi:MAG TPA: N,N-dimethylformamidase beta subunit family domain-containing protein, partial [Streptosporangiaceae bacterium]
MTSPEPPSRSRRAFLGTATAAAAASSALAACSRVAGSSGARPATVRATPSPRPVAENLLPGDPGWWITHQGAPDAILGYAGQASVLPGEPVHLYVSTTSREFQVRAFRMGWYRGDLARKVWESGTVRGHRQRAATMTEGTNTIRTDWGLSLAVPTDGWPAGSYLLRLDAHSGGQRYVPL